MDAYGLGTYTLWVMASESGFGLPEDVEGLAFAGELELDVIGDIWS